MRLSTVASSELVRVTCINFPAEAQELLIRSHRFSDHREFQSVLEKEDFDAFWSFPSLTSQESDSLLLLDMLSFFFFFHGKESLLYFRCWQLVGWGLYAETAQSSLKVIFKVVISGLTRVILVVLGTVNLQFQDPFVSISLRPVLGIVAAYVMGTV